MTLQLGDTEDMFYNYNNGYKIIANHNSLLPLARLNFRLASKQNKNFVKANKNKNYSGRRGEIENIKGCGV